MDDSLTQLKWSGRIVRVNNGVVEAGRVTVDETVVLRLHLRLQKQRQSVTTFEASFCVRRRVHRDQRGVVCTKKRSG